MSQDLAEYVDQFRNFSDDAAPAPEVEIKVKGSSTEFCRKYLTDKKYIVIEVKPGFVYLHCKPKYLLPLLDLEEVEHLERVPGIYEPM